MNIETNLYKDKALWRLAGLKKTGGEVNPDRIADLAAELVRLNNNLKSKIQNEVVGRWAE
jgi:hypothetical protein